MAEYRPDEEYDLPLLEEPYPSNLRDSPFPGELAQIADETRIRDLRVICLSVYPVQYTRSAQSVTCHSEIVVTVRFVQPSPSIAEFGAGPLDGICERQIVGYEGRTGSRGMAPLSSLSDGEQESEASWGHMILS